MKHNPNSKYWRKKADAEVSKYYRGQPCKVCGSVQNTCGHHIVARSLSSSLRHSPKNIIPLCHFCHMFSNELAAHSRYQPAQTAFVQWLKDNYPDGYDLLMTYKHYAGSKVDYEQAYNEWREMNEV